MLHALMHKRRIAKARATIAKSFDLYKPSKLAVAWTGGKDSTLMIWLIRDYCKSHNISMPQAVFIDNGDVFPEIFEFIKKYSKLWDIQITTIENEDLLKNAGQIGSVIRIADLNARNRAEIRRLGIEEEKFSFSPESYIGNHLLKTVPFNQFISLNGLDAVFVGIRKDENEARAKERYFSRRNKPDHTRIHPLLSISEKDVWQETHELSIPYVALYEAGYRSLGARSSTTKVSNIPAWQQLSGEKGERSGRKQDKEKIMSRLRKIGYM